MKAATTIWMQSLRGRAIDHLAPRAEDVDFREIAETLATLHRYAGAAEIPVSVANHTLICLAIARREGASDTRLAYVALHDAHEAYIGEIPTPTAQAIAEIAARAAGPQVGRIVTQSIARLEGDHDIAIHKAAGIDEPELEDIAFVRRVDIGALNVERRHWLAPAPRPWAPSVEAHPVPPVRARLRSPADAADLLHEAFVALLPGARAQSARRAGSDLWRRICA